MVFGSGKVKPLFGSTIVATYSMGEECTIGIRRAYAVA